MGDDLDALLSQDQEDWDKTSLDPSTNMMALADNESISDKAEKRRITIDATNQSSSAVHFNQISRIETEQNVTDVNLD